MHLGALIEKLAADVPDQRERQSVSITKVEELICSQENALAPAKDLGNLANHGDCKKFCCNVD